MVTSRIKRSSSNIQAFATHKLAIRCALGMVAALLVLISSAPLSAQSPAPPPAPPPAQQAPETPDEARQAAVNKALGNQARVRFGVALFPVNPPPQDSCIAQSGVVGDTRAYANAVDGSSFNKPGKLEDLRKKQKSGTIFVRGGNFEGTKLGKEKLYNMCFIDANFRYTNWEGFDGYGLGFINSDLTGARLTKAKMHWTLFRDVTLTDADASAADLSGGRLDGGWQGSMKNLNLNDANLTGFRVECGYTAQNGCPLDRQGLSLRGANLTKASFYAFDFPDVDVSNATVDQTEIGLQHVARLSGAKLVGPVVVRSHNSAAIYLPAEYARIRGALMAGAGGAASASCKTEQNVIKKAICVTPGTELRRLSREVAELDQDIIARNRRHAADQRTWESSVTAKCGTLAGDEIGECLKTEYRLRREALVSKAGSPRWLRPGQYALFIASEAPLSEEFLRSELFLRVRPVLFDSAASRVMVKVERNGRVTAKGSAMGVCQLNAPDLSFNRASGWISGGATPATRTRRAEPGIPVLQAIGDRLEVYRGGNNMTADGTLAPNPYVRCGPQGSFTLMQLVPLSQGELEQLWNIFR